MKMNILTSTTQLLSFVFILGLIPFIGLKAENTTNDNRSESQQKRTEEKANKPNAFDFVGTYTFEEDHGKTAGGTGIFYVHTIIIGKENGQYTAKYTLYGYQVSQEIECSVMEVKINESAPASSLILQFEKYGEVPGFKPDIYETQQELFEISPKGGMMAVPDETDIDVVFKVNMTTDNQVGERIVFERE